MVFSSAAMVTVAEVSVDTWQRMRRIPSSEMLNRQELLEMACCFPLGHLVLCLWEFLCFPLDNDNDDDDDADDADDEDMVAFDHNSYGYDYADDHHHGSSSSSTLDSDDDYYHYSD